MKKTLLLTGLIMLFTLVGVKAQDAQAVSGRVTDGNGQGIPGVTVLEKGTNNGTVTDIDGRYNISVGDDAILVISYVGFQTQEVPVDGQTSIDISLEEDVQQLSEVVVVGYGTQEKKEITSAVTTVTPEEFNRGNVNEPSQLLQGKVPGLTIVNQGGNPNSSPTIRLRGISTVGANTEPLVVIDGVIGATLDNLDPNDIESVNVLKDGSAAAIYGSRGSSGVILVTTKSGASGGVRANYNTYVAVDEVFRQQPNMSPEEYVAAGGNDLGARTDWQDEVTRTAVSHVHNIAISGGNESTNYRVSTNFRNIQGVLKKSGFDQINARANINHRTLNDRLNIQFNMALTNRESNFSFNEALRYAVLYNPTAPIRFDNGNFFQAILFDNFNPVAILEQNQNLGRRKNLNFNGKIDFNVTDQITVTANYAQQYENNLNGEYYPRSSFFRGLNRGGLARRFTDDSRFTLFETYATYLNSFGDFDLNFSAGYSFQEDEFNSVFVELGDFPLDDLGFNALELSGNRVTGTTNQINISSDASPENRIIAFFGRVNLSFDNTIFFNASVRREGSSKLGVDNQWGTFPALGIGVNLNNYLNLANVDQLKFRVGYGVTGSLPGPSGLAQDLFIYDPSQSTDLIADRDANPDLKWEEKTEINLGIDFGIGGKLSGALELYTRNIQDFIQEVQVPVDQFPSGLQFQNVGELETRGIELSLNYNSLEFGEFRWSPGIVASSYRTELVDFLEGFEEGQMRSILGSPGQQNTDVIRVATGEEIGQIWGPVFAGVNENGEPTFADLNNDGQILSDPGSALLPEGDFQTLGNGIPDLELGWTNQVTWRNWDLNAFFRAAFGHSLVNTYRAFYEPIDPGAINSYNRIITDKAVDGLTVAQFSSLYVEEADFFRLDNITLGYNFPMDNSKAFRNIRAQFTVQNVFVLTNYTGLDPDPQLQDFGTVDNGDFLGTTGDVLAPGIDRRNNYFTARTFTLGVNIGFN